MASPAQEARNARARALGFRNDYEARIRGGISTAKPSDPRPSGDELRRARGHASLSDLVDDVKAGRVQVLAQIPGDRDPRTGRYTTATVDVTLTNGKSRTYKLRSRELERDKLGTLRAAVRGAGTDVYVNPSLDLFDLAGDDDLDDVDLEDFDLEDEVA